MHTVNELIETLWNVNNCRKKQGGKLKWELIETLWNVNLAQKALPSIKSLN